MRVPRFRVPPVTSHGKNFLVIAKVAGSGGRSRRRCNCWAPSTVPRTPPGKGRVRVDLCPTVLRLRPCCAATGDEAGSLRLGMAATIYHWGLHPWAIYAVVALALALFSFNKGLPLSIRSIFYPLLGFRPAVSP